jgi:aldehyde:ferredoxin oxidoreductase
MVYSDNFSLKDNKAMHGFHGKILFIDLTTQTHRLEFPAPEIYLKWIGGKGMAGFLLALHITRVWEDPPMPVLLMAGPLVGTLSPSSGRMCIMSRSPLTGTVGSCSIGGAPCIAVRLRA